MQLPYVLTFMAGACPGRQVAPAILENNSSSAAAGRFLAGCACKPAPLAAAHSSLISSHQGQVLHTRDTVMKAQVLVKGRGGGKLHLVVHSPGFPESKFTKRAWTLAFPDARALQASHV